MRAALLLLLLALSGCATLLDGRTQPLTIATEPPGAACSLTRQGALLATIDATPATIRIERSPYEILLTCQRPGHAPGRAFLRSADRLGPAASAGDYLLGAGPGYSIDSLTGADRQYRQAVTLPIP